jgi:CBS domain-containing protein
MPLLSPTPSASLLAGLRNELMRWPPFAQMSIAHVEHCIRAASQAYFASGETVLSPQDGPVEYLYLVRNGSITGSRAEADAAGAFQIDAGDMFPVGAVMAGRAVTTTYRADEDTSCLLLPQTEVQTLAAQSVPFADFLNARMQRLLELSRSAWRAEHASQAWAEQSFESPLSSLLSKAPVAAVRSDTPLAQALALMHQRRVGSVLITDGAELPVGILTRHDMIHRIILPQVSLAAPISQVMSAPVHTLDTSATALDAAMLMSRRGIRHVPVTDGGRVVGIVSERDLFSMQRLSIKQASVTIRSAADLSDLQAAAADIRRLAGRLLAQGMGARHLTELISHLNDVLTVRVLQLAAVQHGLDLSRSCWLAFGSEGRNEQTVATDQDNGLVFESDDPGHDRPAWLAFARSANEALDACGYPLCRGNVMASNPACCLSLDEWCARFEHWIDHGAPEDLLKASIYFDFRPLAGNIALALPLRDIVTRGAARTPRFIKQMADNALRNRSPLDWRGSIDTIEVDGRKLFDLKAQGTAIFVDLARLYALAHGIGETGTRRRFETAAAFLEAPARESESWSSAFEFLQLLRLQVQLRSGTGADRDAHNPNLIEPAVLNDIDRRMLSECLRVLRRLRQRVELDYRR